MIPNTQSTKFSKVKLYMDGKKIIRHVKDLCMLQKAEASEHPFQQQKK